MIDDVLTNHNVPFKRHGEHHHSRPGWVSVDCPNCSPASQHYRLGFHLASGRAHCWACGRIDAAQAVATICHVKLHLAIELLGAQRTAPQSTPVASAAGVLRRPNNIRPMGTLHRSYLRARGFDPDEIARIWEVEGIEMAPRLQWRLFIPIFDRNGYEVSWTTRAISTEVERRYISAELSEEVIPHKSLLYGAHLAGQSIIVVEGPVDAWAIGPGAVATFGLSVNRSQLNEIAKYPRRTICFDTEPAAQARAKRLYNDLRYLSGVTKRATLETGKDAATADQTEICELRRLL